MSFMLPQRPETTCGRRGGSRLAAPHSSQPLRLGGAGWPPAATLPPASPELCSPAAAPSCSPQQQRPPAAPGSRTRLVQVGTVAGRQLLGAPQRLEPPAGAAVAHDVSLGCCCCAPAGARRRRPCARRLAAHHVEPHLELLLLLQRARGAWPGGEVCVWRGCSCGARCWPGCTEALAICLLLPATITAAARAGRAGRLAAAALPPRARPPGRPQPPLHWLAGGGSCQQRLPAPAGAPTFGCSSASSSGPAAAAPSGLPVSDIHSSRCAAGCAGSPPPAAPPPSSWALPPEAGRAGDAPGLPLPESEPRGSVGGGGWGRWRRS
jgi:hypothetical protein